MIDRRAVAEYAHVPQTHRNTVGPCVVPGCQNTVYTQRGACRQCTAAERKPA